jgi:hypothetical protein
MGWLHVMQACICWPGSLASCLNKQQHHHSSRNALLVRRATETSLTYHTRCVTDGCERMEQMGNYQGQPIVWAGVL